MTIEAASRISVYELGLSTRVTRCAHDINLDTLYQVAQLSESDWFRHRNIGKKSLKEIKSKLSELGVHMGMRDSEWERDSSGIDGDAAEEERRVGKLVLELFSILNARSTNRKDRQGK